MMNMIKVPPYLNPGDTIGIVCPAGYMDYSKATECIRVLQEEWGYKVKTGTTLGSASQNYFSGTDAERLQDLQQMLDDDSVHAILCARGGYGMGRIIDWIDFSKFRANPKWIIGFSDITILHSHLHTHCQIASIHGPMAAAFNDGGYKNQYVQSLRTMLQGKPATYMVAPHFLNKAGRAMGELVGGNLALLAHTVGTPSALQTKGKILFIEDIGEYKYNIDRMLYQLKRSGMFNDLRGLIFGGFSDIKDTDRPFGKELLQIIFDMVHEYSYPICFNFPVSHETENYALKIGVRHSLHVFKDKVMLQEM